MCLSFVEERVVFVCGRGRVLCCGQGGREREACRGENTVAVCYSRGEWLRVVQIELKLTCVTTERARRLNASEVRIALSRRRHPLIIEPRARAKRPHPQSMSSVGSALTGAAVASNVGSQSVDKSPGGSSRVDYPLRARYLPCLRSKLSRLAACPRASSRTIAN